MEKSKCKFACQRKQELPILERRLFKIEVRQTEEGEKKLIGTPIVYNKRSEDLGFFEIIKPGASTEALKRSDTRLLYGHNSTSLLPLARISSGTLRATETKKGVDIEADPPKKNQFVDALIESIDRRDVQEMSFGFTIEADEWKDLDKDRPTRMITKFREIFDYSYVTFAAYGETTAGTDVRVALRSLDTARGVQKDNTDPAFTLVSETAEKNQAEIRIRVEVNGTEVDSHTIRFAENKTDETDPEIETETDSTEGIETDPAETRDDDETVIETTVATEGQTNPEIGNTDINARDLFKQSDKQWANLKPELEQ
ncbi:hypothetical protein LCGC14_0646890 [marine sediment metagenome]|uniref:Prohead serine protease domain-containing protein n=1 Tax=marine sediment metagenome TaxID=412755 RepID=A0A0F9RH36_9ZZZZ|nr:HK97 family phage prohead protease [Pricia sp.]